LSLEPLEERWLPAISQFPIPTAHSQPNGIARGPDGNLWFAESHAIGRITPVGVITEFSTGLAAASSPQEITTGPDGNLWFSDQGTDRIGRITPAGVITEFSTGITAGTGPFGITAGPDGNLWFTEQSGGIGRITTTGAVTEFSAGLSLNSQPTGITAGPDGNLWFTEQSGDRIGRIMPAGTITQFSMGITLASATFGITAGPDGNLWFAESQTDRIGRITPAGVVTEFSAGISHAAAPADITAGPDGNLWFTEINGLGRITPAGTVTEFTAGITPGSAPFGIAAGQDGNLWFAEFSGNQIGRLATPGLVAAATTTALNSAAPSAEFGRPVTLTASVTSGAATPGGVVTFFEGTTVLGTATVDSTGHAMLPVSLAVGAHTLTASYAATTAFAASTSAAFTETVVPAAVISEFPIPTAHSQPSGITRGPDGNLWFTESHAIGRITPTGVVTEFTSGLSAGSAPGEITAGADGNLWFIEGGTNRIGRITTAGVITEFSSGTDFLFGITAGPDGNLWYTADTSIGRITTAGQVTIFATGISANSQPFDLTTGPDGNVWFTESGFMPSAAVGRITIAGQITEFSTGITGGSQPLGIVAGPDGNLWFTEENTAKVGRITSAGQVTEFAAGITSGAVPLKITTAPDGNFWFTEISGNRIGRITPTGTVTEFPVATGTGPDGITLGSDGKLWFTEFNGNQIGRMDVPVAAGIFSKYLVTFAGSATIQAGASVLTTVQAADQFGNPILNYTGPSSVMASINPASASSSGAPGFPMSVAINSSGLGFFLATLQKVGTYTITVASGAFTGSAAPVTVVPGPATRLAFDAQPASAPTGVTLPSITVQVLDAFGNLVTSDNTDTVTLGIASGPGPFTPDSATAATVHNGVAAFSNLTLVKPGSYTLSELVNGLHTGPNSSAFTVLPLQVVPGSFAGSPSGFSLQFNAPFLVNATTPVLYGQGFGSAAPVPSVTLTQTRDAGGNAVNKTIAGSLVLNPATNSITFVATNTALLADNGSPLLPDGAYVVDLTSSAAHNGFQALNSGGGFLDGLGTGTSGSGDYTATFSVDIAAAHEDVIWVPATADGPGQPLLAPGANQVGFGLPVYINDSTGAVTDVLVTLNYNPALLHVIGAVTNVDGVLGSSFKLVPALSSPGHTVLEFKIGTGDPAVLKEGQVPLGFVDAAVFNGTAANPIPYKAEDLLHLSNVSLNGGSIPAVTGDAVHLVAFVGDADGNGAYSSSDAVLITRATLQTDSGFAAYPLVAPVIVADTDGTGFIPADAALQVNEAGVGFPTSNLAPIPSGVVFSASNVDQARSIASALQSHERIFVGGAAPRASGQSSLGAAANRHPAAGHSARDTWFSQRSNLVDLQHVLSELLQARFRA
jgi:streptogramin lyase